jgi:hypothetical protein
MIPARSLSQPVLPTMRVTISFAGPPLGLEAVPACRAYQNTEERAEMLDPFMDYYNRFRPSGGIDGATPIRRVRS